MCIAINFGLHHCIANQFNTFFYNDNDGYVLMDWIANKFFRSFFRKVFITLLLFKQTLFVVPVVWKTFHGNESGFHE